MKITLLVIIVLALTASGFAQSAFSVKGGPARLMSAPDTDSTLIVEIPSGAVVEPIRSEEGSDWLYVSFREFRGWVLKSRLAESEGDLFKPQADIKIAAERSAVDEHIAAVITKSPKSVRDRGLTELKDLRSEAKGDLDGDGDEDIAAAYSLGVGTEPRSTHLAVFENAGERFRLLLDERLAAGTVVRVAGIYNRKLQIEVSGIVREFEVVAGRLSQVAEEDEMMEPEPQAPTSDEGGDTSMKVSEVEERSPPSAPKRIAKGVLNELAIDLPAPEYPAAARAVGASGVVNVAVVISKDGDLISANAVSGHPLLRSAAVDAARRARFNPTLDEGVPVEVSGTIVYNFQ
ncbi:MAG: TonB family protein [Aridibacter famidurans]|nr:TonB family protein [Aridibacter famidurans]